jgi:polysaccharide export outer membrane protein
MLAGLTCCNTYRQSIMFGTDQSIRPEVFEKAVLDVERSYRLVAGDVITFRLYTNKGERIIDPASDQESVTPQQAQGQQYIPQYTVRPDGIVRLPMIGELAVQGLAIYQLDSLLARRYAQFYTEPFALSQINSRRVVVLGGTKSSVVPLTFENMTLIEVLAITGGPDEYSRVKNIRLIRGDLKQPSVQLIDLSTIAGMQKASLTLQPNDIVYIEPIPRAGFKATNDLLPILGTLLNVVTIVFVLTQL